MPIDAARTMRQAVGLVCAVALAGCATAGGGDPGARSLPSGQTCQSVKAELSRMDSQGARAKVEAASSGRPVSAETRAVANRYNELLNEYLGARCQE